MNPLAYLAYSSILKLVDYILVYGARRVLMLFAITGTCRKIACNEFWYLVFSLQNCIRYLTFSHRYSWWYVLWLVTPWQLVKDLPTLQKSYRLHFSSKSLRNEVIWRPRHGNEKEIGCNARLLRLCLTHYMLLNMLHFTSGNSFRWPCYRTPWGSP